MMLVIVGKAASAGPAIARDKATPTRAARMSRGPVRRRARRGGAALFRCMTWLHLGLPVHITTPPCPHSRPQRGRLPFLLLGRASVASDETTREVSGGR